MEKKKISLKEIGMPRLVMIFMAGLLIIILSFPGLFGTQKTKKTGTDQPNTEIVQKDTNTTSYDTNTYISEMENKLVSILNKVSGIGNVKVMITLKASGKQVALKDTPSTQDSLNEDDGEGGSRAENHVTGEESTVIVTDDSGNSTPFIIQEIEPEVEGVVVIADGGDNIKVIADIMEAVQVLFDVPANKVKVMKMGQETK